MQIRRRMVQQTRDNIVYHPGSDAMVVIQDQVQIIRETADVLYEARNKLFLRERTGGTEIGFE
jgi:hypothetical protein